MAIGNKAGRKKKIVQRKNPDPYIKKEWYPVYAPAQFKHRYIGQTPVTKSAGLKVATDIVNHRIYEVNLGDLNPTENDATGNTKFFLQTQAVVDGKCLTNFVGMDMTRHKYGSLFRKGCDFIQTFSDVQTTDNYVVRVFTVAFTDVVPGQKKRNCYIKGAEMQRIRTAIYDTVAAEVGKSSLSDLVLRLANYDIDKVMAENVKKTGSTCRDVMIRRVKVVKRPRFSMDHLNAMHDEKLVGSSEGATISM
ncbi:Ribosomal protein S3a [Giardia muris]|uniref:Small ribosomal subunit protein eS1 n=1 Tax=Giardia muris TaxID=5742 RepID=A0A4Z1T8P0_GIAMU|nr:Ribosomal protein S3a [Giardia muris]|eukprot:TNJ29497.1 Ribosomal protein S3a [Giardia muris]